MESKLPPQCLIDKNGLFKYIQILETSSSDPNYKRILLRGTTTCSFHREIFKEFKASIDSKSKYHYKPIGGGRINCETTNKIFVYGYSTVYGQCDHDLTCKILKEHFGNNMAITYSNEGY